MDQELTDLGSQMPQLLLGKVLQISGPADLFQHPVSLRSHRKGRSHEAGTDTASLVASVGGEPGSLVGISVPQPRSLP